MFPPRSPCFPSFCTSLYNEGMYTLGKVDNMERVCRAPWNCYVPPIQMGPHVWYVSGNDWVASYLIDTGDGLVLIDTAMHESLYLLLENIHRLGYDPHEIKVILLSHAHNDHIGGAKALKELTGAKLYLGKGDLYFLHERPDLVLSQGYTCGLFEPDGLYDDETPIRIGNAVFHTTSTPGHTPGCTSFRFEQDGLVYAMHGGLGFNTMSKDYFDFAGLPYSLVDDFYAGLKKLDKWKVDIALPSHTNQIRILEKRDRAGKEPNPYLDPEAWHVLLKERMQRIEPLLKEKATW